MLCINQSICTSATEFLLQRSRSRCAFPFMHTTIHSECLKGSGGVGSVPLIKVSSLWVVTQPDRGSTPDLLMRVLQRGRQSLSLCGPTWGFSVGGVAPLSINIFPVKCRPLIHLAAHSALYKTSQCFYCKSESCNPALPPLLNQAAKRVSRTCKDTNIEEDPKIIILCINSKLNLFIHNLWRHIIHLPLLEWEKKKYFF